MLAFIAFQLALVQSQDSMLIEKTSLEFKDPFEKYMRVSFQVHADKGYSGKSCDIDLVGDEVQMACGGNWFGSDTMKSFVSGHKLKKESEALKSEYDVQISDGSVVMKKNGEELLTKKDVQSADHLDDHLALVSTSNELEIFKIDSSGKLESVFKNELQDVLCSTKLKLGLNVVVSYCDQTNKLSVFQRKNMRLILQESLDSLKDITLIEYVEKETTNQISQTYMFLDTDTDINAWEILQDMSGNHKVLIIEFEKFLKPYHISSGHSKVPKLAASENQLLFYLDPIKNIDVFQFCRMDQFVFPGSTDCSQSPKGYFSLNLPIEDMSPKNGRNLERVITEENPDDHFHFDTGRIIYNCLADDAYMKFYQEPPAYRKKMEFMCWKERNASEHSRLINSSGGNGLVIAIVVLAAILVPLTVGLAIYKMGLNKTQHKDPQSQQKTERQETNSGPNSSQPNEPETIEIPSANPENENKDV